MIQDLRVACVQLEAHDVDEAEVALEEALEAVDRAAAQNAHLIVLPECTYPGYMLRGWGQGAGRRAAEEALARAVRVFSEKAARHGCYLAVGLVESEGDTLYNAAILFDPAGKIVGKARKHFLWHFDSNWFAPGSEFGVWETPWGKMGMLICADARIPEVSRILKIKGARILLDLANWTSSGKKPATLTNPQVEYMLRTRALENQMWYVAADKVGMEQGSIVYCGSSCVVSPEGELVARASSDQPEILVAEIPGGEDVDGRTERGTLVDGRFDPVAARQPAEYRVLSRPYTELTIREHLEEKLVPGQHAVLTAALQMGEELATPERWTGALRRYIAVLAEQRVELVVFPEPSELLRPDGFLPVLETALKESNGSPNMVVVLTGPEDDGGRLYKTSYILAGGRIIGKYRKLHLEVHEANAFVPGDLGLPVFATPIGRLGVMLGYEGLVPEVARVLTLEGADLIAWPADFTVCHHEHVARTRAAENRVFVVAANTNRPGPGGSLIVDPAGTLLAQGFYGRTQAVTALCDLSAARVKTVVPGTDVIAGRRPADYKAMTGTWE